MRSATWSAKFDPDIPDAGFHLGILTSTGHDQHGPAELPQPPLRHRRRPIRPAMDRLRAAGRAPCLVAALKVADGALYASTLETGATERGRLLALRRATGGGSTSATPSGATSSTPWPSSAARSTAASAASWARGPRSGPLPNRTPGGQSLPGHRRTARWTYCRPSGVRGRNAGGRADRRLRVREGRRRLRPHRPPRADSTAVSNHRRGAFAYEGGERWTLRRPGPPDSLPRHPSGRPVRAASTVVPCTAYAGGSELGRPAAARPDRPRPTPRSPATDTST